MAYGVSVKREIYAEKKIKVIDGYCFDVSSVTVSGKQDIAQNYNSIMIPASIILNICMVDNLDNFPDAHLWCTSTKEDAEKRCWDMVEQEEKEWTELNRKYSSEFIRNYNTNILKSDAIDEYDKLPWYKKRNMHDFVKKYVEDKIDSCTDTSAVGYLKSKGVSL
jgi:hypothetical protein